MTQLDQHSFENTPEDDRESEREFDAPDKEEADSITQGATISNNSPSNMT